MILRSCGDGDLAIFVGDLVISTDLKKQAKSGENYHFFNGNCHFGAKNMW